MQILRRALVALSLILTLAPNPLGAFEVLLATGSNEPVHWEALIIPYEVAENPGDVSVDAAIKAVRDAADAWEKVGCHTLHFIYQGAPEENKAAVDGHNRILWIQEGWPGTPAELAITIVTRSTSTGRIADTDLLLNDAAYPFSLSETPLDTEIPLLGVLTHEWGHILGLDHSNAEGATMTASVLDNIHELASLEADDRVGLCSLYEPAPPTEDESIEEDEATYRESPESRKALPVSLFWALPLLVAAGLLIGKRVFWPGCLLVVVLCCSDAVEPSPDSATLDAKASDIGDTLGIPDADTPDADGANLVDVDSGEDTDVEDPFQSVILSDLMAESSLWRVIRWESADQVLAGDEIATTWEHEGARTLRFGFFEDGVLREFLGEENIVENNGCTVSGSWESTDSTLVWRWNTLPTFCPGERPVREEVLAATYDATTETLRLELLENHWRLGNTGRELRPYRIYLQADETTPVSEDCPPLPEPVLCNLTCSVDAVGDTFAPSHNLSCAPPDEVKSCSSTLDQETGDVVEQECQRGCYLIHCELTYDEAGLPIGGCEASPGDQACTYTE